MDPSKISLTEKFKEMMDETFYGGKKTKKKRKKRPAKPGQVDYNILPGVKSRKKALEDAGKY